MPETLKNGFTVENDARFGLVRIILAKGESQFATWFENAEGITVWGHYFEWPHQYANEDKAYFAAFRDYILRCADEGRRYRAERLIKT